MNLASTAFHPKAYDCYETWQVFWLTACCAPSRFLQQWYLLNIFSALQQSDFTATGIAHDFHVIPF
jgi:hypothetical protein